MNTSDTIIAPATPPGDGGVAIVRISGVDALSALKKYFRPSAAIDIFTSHRLYHGTLLDQSGEKIDEVMAVYMASPRTYTCDDVVEIQCHGSQQVVKSILKLYLAYGIRLAEPGEFTYRAYVNGRLDLSQAEAVSSLIHAKSQSSHKLALAQVGGALSREIFAFTASLKNALVLTEAWIDFPEEDLPAEDVVILTDIVARVIDKSLMITDSYGSGRVLSEGASILLVGQPNVGKSSLLNALLGEDRAIVTAVPGTTRDLLEEGLTIEGVPVRLVDTAGLRKSTDAVEIEGIRRAESKMQQADLVLLVVDGTREPDELDFYVHNLCQNLPTFLVLTKGDITSRSIDLSFSDFPVYPISSKKGLGLAQLSQAIAEFLVGDHLLGSESVMLTERRHYEALHLCVDSLKRASGLLQGQAPLELLAFELREALYGLGQISGETTTESVLDDIFSGFCIGK
ncbi:MAG: tRNA uridine-5-carboxymethylaminomethyl(34) synthesis GTPase MnmE [Desulfuromonadales bacterium]|nr:tRNA uridine-5-carboxymethylaminomethyl(34) synthesis GTPase MnmE [Desulfuromonadales bacterium]